MRRLRAGAYWLDHDCTWYCQHGLHAVLCLAVPTWTPEQVRQEAQAMGLMVQHVRPGRELDACLVDRAPWAWYRQSTATYVPVRPQEDCPDHTAAWVLVCANAVDDEETA